MAKSEICKQGLRCERCTHVWVPHNINNLPTACPKCHSPYWNKPRKNKSNDSIKGTSGIRGSTVKQPMRTPIRTRPPTSGRGSSFSTPVRRNIPKRPTKRQIDSAGIGGAT